MKEKDKKINELLNRIQQLENENKDLKDKISNQKKLNIEKSKRKISKSREYDNYDSSTEEELMDTESESQDEIMNIDMNELREKSKKEIIKIAKSIDIKDIVGKSNKKKDILKKIQDKIQIKKIRKQKRNGSMVKRKSLLIVPIESYGEKLFWKIIRNKYLFRQITSHLFTGKHSLRYDQLYDIQLLISFGAIELLKYKVKRGDYLTNFYSYNLHSLLGVVGHDIEFARNLFKNYPKSCLSDINYTGASACNSNSSACVQILVSDYGFKPSIDNIRGPIRLGSLKTISTIINYYKDSNLPLPFTDSELWKVVFSSPNSKVFKIINYLINVKGFNYPTMTESRVSKLYKTDEINYDDSFYKNDFLIKDLVQFCRSVFSLHLTKSKLLPNLINPFQSLNQFNQLFSSFSNEELKLSVLSYIINHSNLIHQKQQQQHESIQFNNILKLLSMYFSIIKSPAPFYLLLKNSYNNDNSNNNNNDNNNSDRFKEELLKSIGSNLNTDRQKEIYKDSFRFANIDILLNHPLLDSNCYFPNQLISNEVTNFTFKSFLFQFEKDKEKQVQFIKSISNSVRDKKININSSELFYIILDYDDLELIKLAYEELGKPNLKIEKTIQSIVSEFTFIKSTQVLEFVFDNCLKEKDTPRNVFGFVLNQRIDLLEKYKSLLPNTVTALPLPPMADLVYPPHVLSTFIQICSHPVLSKCITIDRAHFTRFSLGQLGSISKIVYLLENFKDINFTFIYNECYFTHSLNRFLFYNSGYKNRITYSYIPSQMKELFHQNQVDLYDSKEYGYLEFINNFMKVNFGNLMVKNNNSDSLLIQQNDQNQQQEEEVQNEDNQPESQPQQQVNLGRGIYIEQHGLHSILFSQAGFGNLHFFETLFYNGFESLFYKKRDNNKVFFNQYQLRELLIEALRCDHLELSLFFYEKCGIRITSNLFHSALKNKNISTFIHLLNKFK